ncbi:unnamed protein product, partial [Rangifer tarandus platyrhynchus]
MAILQMKKLRLEQKQQDPRESKALPVSGHLDIKMGEKAASQTGEFTSKFKRESPHSSVMQSEARSHVLVILKFAQGIRNQNGMIQKVTCGAW